MPLKLEIIFLLIGLFAIVIISFFISRRITEHLSTTAGEFTYLFVGLLALYYLVDVILHNPNPLTSLYFYFWCSVFFIEVLLFIRVRKRKTRNG